MDIKKYIGCVLKYCVIFFVIIISVFPLLWLVLSSFKTNNEILESAFSLPKTPSFYGYKVAIETTKLHFRFLTSCIITGISTVIAVAIYSMAAYALARFSFKGRVVVFTILISSILIPANTMIQPIYTLIRWLGLYDTKAALILVYTGFAMPMCLFLIRSYFMNIPKELEEAAEIEGAGFYKVFVTVMFPLAKPAISSAAVLTCIFSWNELLYALLLTSAERNRTLPVTLRYFTSMFSFNYPPMFAALTIYILPTILMYIILQKQIMQSLVSGAIKG